MDMLKLGTLADGTQVWNRHDCHMHDGVAKLIPFVLINTAKPHPSAGLSLHTFTFPSPIGVDLRVETYGDEKVFWAQRYRGKSTTWSRFVVRETASLSTNLSFILKVIDDGYTLITAFIGTFCIGEPTDKRLETPEQIAESIAYWKNHAFIAMHGQYDPETVRYTPPEGGKWG
jgi:hypothetical protein